MKAISFVVNGKPVPQRRGRIGTRGTKPFMYNHADSDAYKAHVGVMAKSAMNRKGCKLFTGGVIVTITVFVAIPKSYSKAKRKLIEEGKLLPTGRPDLSNIIKNIEDGMNEIVYKDDSQIVKGSQEKLYGDKAYVIVEAVEDTPSIAGLWRLAIKIWRGRCRYL